MYSGPGHGFLFSNGVMLDLNNYTDASSGWTIVDASGINDRDQIAAVGTTGTCPPGPICPRFALLLSPCNDGTVDPGEQCDDGNGADDDGCRSDCTLMPLTATQTFGPGGGTLDTGGAATPSRVIQVTVTTPNADTVSIAINGGAPSPPPPAGFELLGTQVAITAASTTSVNPLEIVFRLDASIIPPCEDETTIEITKDGGPQIVPCSASQTPCVSVRERLPDGDVQITVLSTTASWWGFAVGASDAPATATPLKIYVNNGKLIKFIAKGTFPLPAPATDDPRSEGGELFTGFTPTAGETISLPASGWSALGNPPGSKGFKYKDPTGVTCKKLMVKNNIIKGLCTPTAAGAPGSDYTVSPILIELSVGSATQRYCAQCGNGAGTQTGNAETVTKFKDCPPAPSCPFLQ
jgi:cysteine-rich repeat protein